jgi:phage FluMu protein Com
MSVRLPVDLRCPACNHLVIERFVGISFRMDCDRCGTTVHVVLKIKKTERPTLTATG